MSHDSSSLVIVDEFRWQTVVLWHKIFWLVKDLMTCLCLPINGDREREREKDSGRKRVEGGRKGEGEGGSNTQRTVWNWE